MGLTTTGANALIDALTGRSQFPFGTIYLGLSRTEPTKEGTNVSEPFLAGNGYGRVLLGNYNQAATLKMSAAANGISENNLIIYFNEIIIANWGTLTHLLFFTSTSATIPIAFAPLSSPITPAVNTIPIIRIPDPERGISGLKITMV